MGGRVSVVVGPLPLVWRLMQIIRIPGEQPWTQSPIASSSTRLSDGMKNLTMTDQLPAIVRSKYPLPAKQGDYLGALIKV